MVTNADGMPLSGDPRALIRSRQYRALLVLAAIVGLVVSVASWLFLEGVVKAGLAVAPLVIIAVVVAYLTSEALTAYVDGRVGSERRPAEAAHPGAAQATA